MFLSELIGNELGIIELTGHQDINIYNVVYDSRKAIQGSLFVCIEGYKNDGHDYINDAIKNGAVAVVVQKPVDIPSNITTILVKNTRYALSFLADRFYGNPSSKFKLIGVTGTNGKTTTTFLIKSILEKSGKNVGLIGTNAVIIGDQVSPAERTTPESLDLQRIFSDMAEKRVEYVVMEVSSHSLELNRVDFCKFQTGIFTNLTRDHLDFHLTFDNYFKAKMKLFDKSKKGVINIDDAYGELALERSNCEVVSYGIDCLANVRAAQIVHKSDGVQFKLIYPKGEADIEVSMPGNITVYNALAAIATCIDEGISIEDIKGGLKDICVPGRAEVVKTATDFTVIIDYAHTPDGLENILKTIKEHAKGRVICLFGCGGDRDKEKRPLMGEISGKLADFTIITSDNPRTEEPDAIINDIVSGIKNTSGEYVAITDRRDAIKYALDNAKKDDLILLAGKGHETYQILKDRMITFDERQIVKEILGERGN